MQPSNPAKAEAAGTFSAGLGRGRGVTSGVHPPRGARGESAADERASPIPTPAYALTVARFPVVFVLARFAFAGDNEPKLEPTAVLPTGRTAVTDSAALEWDYPFGERSLGLPGGLSFLSGVAFQAIARHLTVRPTPQLALQDGHGAVWLVWPQHRDGNGPCHHVSDLQALRVRSFVGPVRCRLRRCVGTPAQARCPPACHAPRR